jgi:hypothetical protein
VALAPADPQQRGLRSSTDRRLHQLLHRFQEPWLSLDLRSACGRPPVDERGVSAGHSRSATPQDHARS